MRALPIQHWDARSGNEDQNQFLKKSDNPDNEGMITFLPKKSGHLQTREIVQLTMLASGRC